MSYESQTRVAFFKGDLGGLLDTSPAEIDLDTAAVAHTEEVGDEQRGIVISRGKTMVRNDSRSVVLKNSHVVEEDGRELVPPNTPVTVESVDNSNTIDNGRASTSQGIQVVTEVPSGVVVENPSTAEEERDTISPSCQESDDFQGVVIENSSIEREGDDTALPTSEATTSEEQGCVVLGNPYIEVEERATTLTRRLHSGSGIEGNSPSEDQVINYPPLVYLLVNSAPPTSIF